jgi:hypothetical protein
MSVISLEKFVYTIITTAALLVFIAILSTYCTQIG